MEKNVPIKNIDTRFEVEDDNSLIESWKIKRGIPKTQDNEPRLELIIYYTVKNSNIIYWHRMNVDESMFKDHFSYMKKLIEKAINEVYQERWLND